MSVPTRRVALRAPHPGRGISVERAGLLGASTIALLCFLVISNLLGGNTLIPGLDRPGVAAGISALTLGLVTAVGLLTLRDRFNWLSLPVMVLGALLMWDLFSMPFSAVQFAAEDYVPVLINTAVFVGLVAAARQERWRSIILFSLAACIAVGGTICIWEFFLSPNAFSTAPGRAAGIYQNPNVASMALSGLLVFHLASMSLKSELWKKVILGIGVLGVLVTVSRTGVIIVCLIFAYWTWFTYGRKNLILFASIIISIGLLFLVALLQMRSSLNLSMDALTRVDSLLGGFGVTDFSQARGGVTQISWDMLRQNIWGYGAGTTLSLPLGPHNMYLGVALDHGLLIAGVYLALWLWLGWRAFLRGGNLVSRLFWLWLGVWNIASHNMFGPVSLGILALGLAMGSYAQSARGRQSLGAAYPTRAPTSGNLRQQRDDPLLTP